MAARNRELWYERPSWRGPCKERQCAPPPETDKRWRDLQNDRGSDEPPGREDKSPTRHLFASWERVRRRIVLAERIFLLSDFDGTLVPLRRCPSDVRVRHMLRHLLRHLADDRVKIGIISGRAIEDVRKRVAVEGLWYSGSHGYAIRGPSGQTRYFLPPGTKLLMRAMRRSLNQRLRLASGLKIELKDGTVAIHYRTATRAERAWAYKALCKALSTQEHLRLMQGKKVWEVLPGGTVDKWKAVQVILAREDFHPRKDLLVYLGDDVTDEVVFRRMRGLSVAVGKDRRTAAAFYLESHSEVTAFLRKIAEIVKGRKEDRGVAPQGRHRGASQKAVTTRKSTED